MHLFYRGRPGGQRVRDGPKRQRRVQGGARLRFPRLHETPQRGAPKIGDVREPLPGGGRPAAPAVVLQRPGERLQHDPLRPPGPGIGVRRRGRITRVPFRRSGAQSGKQFFRHPAGHPALVSPGFVQPQRNGGRSEFRGCRRRQRLRVPDAVQQRHDPLELGQRVPRVLRVADPVQAIGMPHRLRVGPRRLDAHPVQGGDQAPEDGEAAERGQDVSKVRTRNVGEPALGEEDGSRPGRRPLRVPEGALDEPGGVHGIAPGGALDVSGRILG